MTLTIAFQGSKGAYSDLACHAVYADCESLPCQTFDDAFAALKNGVADLAMIPIENSIAGRVAEVHQLLPDAGLHIVGEHFQPVVHHLLAKPGTKLEDIKEAHSHVQAVSQCRNWLQTHGIKSVVTNDTAGSAADVAKRGDKHIAAIASELAGKIYGLESLAADIADLKNNTTRFVVLSRDALRPPVGESCITTLIFRVRSAPAALYKALGGFATNGINITKLESYLVDGHFAKAQFRLDAEGHPDDTNFQHAFEELNFFAEHIHILGVYPAHVYRLKG